DVAYTQIGRSLELPTQAYLGMSDAKIVDAQCGLESSAGNILAALAGVNMVSGAGMMAFENCQSFEKLVIDADVAGMAKHLSRGIQIHDDPIALDLIRDVSHESNFITHEHTYRWFKDEIYYPSPVIDRLSTEDWEDSGALSCWDRANTLVDQLINCYQEPILDQATRDELRLITTKAAQIYGMDKLPPLSG
ncbi:MAG: trimethylamine methyltransferase family protein, partial [Anaerolineales bacterium]|nr:trimethylamine methyltransferase family protein [Anaerolineales bacterium]